MNQQDKTEHSTGLRANERRYGMSEAQDAAKRIYNEMNTAMETALAKVAQRFNADDWDALTHPEPKDQYEPEKEDK